MRTRNTRGRTLPTLETCEARLPLTATVAWIAHEVTPIDTDILIDVDSDGDLDRLIPDADPLNPPANQYLNWRENLGDDQFADPVRVSDEFVAWGEYGYVPSWVIDLDKDGDQDVLVGSLGGFSISYYPAFVNDDGHFRPVGLTTGGEGSVVDLDVGDIDADGDLDLLATRANIAPDWTVSLFPNADEANYFATTTLNWVGGFDPFRSNARFMDVDGDLDLDVVTSEISFTGTQLIWFENSNGKGSFKGPQTITEIQLPVNSIVLVADLNRDGYEDLVWMTDRTVLMPGSPSGLGSAETLLEFVCPGGFVSSDGHIGGALLDVDGDQDLDLMCRDHWFENYDGLGAFDPAGHEIPLPDSNDAIRMDYDGDGDTDFYGNGWWIENRRIGDSNNDGVFGSDDLIAVMAGGKYEVADATSTFDEGDWNQDGRFDSSDLVLAMQSGTYQPLA